MRWRRWVIALMPVAVGLTVAALLPQMLAVSNPIIAIRVDVGTAAILLGSALSMMLVSCVACWEWAERRCRRDLINRQKEAAEERRRFLQRLDHELKNPLTAIRTGLANLAWIPSEEARQETLDSVEAQALRLSRLTSDLRKLADLEIRSLEQTRVDVAELLGEVVAVAQEQPGAKDRQLTLVLPQAPWPVPTILVDQDLLFLALFNLLDNALKFTETGDTVEVRAFEDGNVVVIEVADTGPGIPADELPRIWDELYRGREARGVPGSGLGLALVRAIVERHDGQVTVRSRSGQGTVFTLRLPI